MTSNGRLPGAPYGTWPGSPCDDLRGPPGTGGLRSLFVVARIRPGVLPGVGGWAVAVEDFGFVGIPGTGGTVGVQDQGPAPPVDDNLMVKPALCRYAGYAVLG